MKDGDENINKGKEKVKKKIGKSKGKDIDG